MTVPPKDPRTFKIGDHGELTVPRDYLADAGLGAKMFVRFRVVDGKTIVIEKASPSSNPLDAPLGRKLDRDLFGKIQAEQEKEKERLREKFEKGIAETPKDGDEPPDHPFRWD
jgi:bifunctional DNA-binding transcriptional regulator/antitoxin component of YhaV-PrlF toxin-antitoxin module